MAVWCRLEWEVRLSEYMKVRQNIMKCYLLSISLKFSRTHLHFKGRVRRQLIVKKNYFRCYIVGNKVKGRISERVFQENKRRQIFRKTNISNRGVRNVRFFGKFDVLCFLKTPVLRCAFLPYYRRYIMQKY